MAFLIVRDEVDGCRIDQAHYFVRTIDNQQIDLRINYFINPKPETRLRTDFPEEVAFLAFPITMRDRKPYW
ncbi:hypothetical protein [Luteibacter aegosomatissinici]|uniref:hypothetical protein n=1 Tax=Luteibacter aegosomatissinici TaxID=2911539 RepID=UPI001FFA1ED0|nr:hypothetical protein [Luteibacter aegosomatissinici]UPG93889.1 hypothetical protein L2Y97_18945 [Luteibacter aegosomatissinici]